MPLISFIQRAQICRRVGSVTKSVEFKSECQNNVVHLRAMTLTVDFVRAQMEGWVPRVMLDTCVDYQMLC